MASIAWYKPEAFASTTKHDIPGWSLVTGTYWHLALFSAKICMLQFYKHL